jgi:hypothetical protein
MILVLCGVLVPSLFAQQLTTEMFGPLSGSFTITFTGNVHVSATVDTTQNTADYHINLLSVKGTGTLVAKYVASGATDLLDQGFPGANITVPIQISANLFPNGPCRAAYPQSPVFPVVVTVSFGSDFTLNTVSASVGTT